VRVEIRLRYRSRDKDGARCREEQALRHGPQDKLLAMRALARADHEQIRAHLLAELSKLARRPTAAHVDPHDLAFVPAQRPHPFLELGMKAVGVLLGLLPAGLTLDHVHHVELATGYSSSDAGALVEREATRLAEVTADDERERFCMV
jgi:hypothetical protein